ncbi:sphingolipid homeostasis protein orm1 [Daldinia eschscholtzii]|uniref:Sphingolipid homeostasis protein orm1 n=1 Tax=Daldinia eschscholtzii TaxID=292717 RepID=A0AAX6MFU9_9PEZI
MGDSKSARRRRSSSILQIYQEPQEPIEQLNDQSTLPNLNANWVNAKGAWTIHIVLIVALKILWDVIPGVSQETSWTLTNISYMFGSYIMFHYVRGVPFDFNSGAYDNLNMWEQIDDGAQYTPAKKFLLSVPIVLFLLSTHYTHYDLTYFTINFLAVLGVVIPKLPFPTLQAKARVQLASSPGQGRPEHPHIQLGPQLIEDTEAETDPSVEDPRSTAADA